MAKKKTWAEKLQGVQTHQVKRLDKPVAGMPQNGMMLIATPKIIDDYIKQTQPGQAVTVATMRQDLAHAYHADYTCPLTTGIFLRIVAEAAYEQYRQTQSAQGITPFWRVVQPGSPLAKKLSFGEDFWIDQRQKEGL
jgi:hypothetical protein